MLTAILRPIPQDQDYHGFADARVFLGVANAADVLSNFAFVAVGLIGLVLLWRSRSASQRFSARDEMRAYWVFFSATTLTGFGSAYYHLAPHDAALTWDRLPMSVAFMSLLAAVIAEHLNVKAGVRLLVPLVAIGAASVLYWAALDDLRPYLAVQFGSIGAMLAVSAAFASRYTQAQSLFVAAALYGVAKLFESHDHAVFQWTDEWVSGHTLKHLTAAAALYGIVWSLAHRNHQPTGGKTHG
jgi:hypothetical protein